MRILIVLLLTCFCASGQTLQYRNMNSTQLASNRFLVSIKSGVLLTNPVVSSGTITGNGSGLTNVTDAGALHKAGGVMSGGLGLIGSTNTGPSIWTNNTLASKSTYISGDKFANTNGSAYIIGTNGNIVMSGGITNFGPSRFTGDMRVTRASPGDGNGVLLSVYDTASSSAYGIVEVIAGTSGDGGRFFGAGSATPTYGITAGMAMRATTGKDLGFSGGHAAAGANNWAGNPGIDLFISSDGKIGMGTRITPTAQLDVLGDIRASTTITATNALSGFGANNIRTNIAQFDVSVTDFVIGTRYTNSTRRSFVAASFQLTAAVAGTAAVTMSVEQAGVTNKLTVSAGPLAGMITIEPLTLMVGPGAFYYFTDVTSGAGGSVAIVAGTSSRTDW